MLTSGCLEQNSEGPAAQHLPGPSAQPPSSPAAQPPSSPAAQHLPGPSAQPPSRPAPPKAVTAAYLALPLARLQEPAACTIQCHFLSWAQTSVGDNVEHFRGLGQRTLSENRCYPKPKMVRWLVPTGEPFHKPFLLFKVVLVVVSTEVSVWNPKGLLYQDPRRALLRGQPKNHFGSLPSESVAPQPGSASRAQMIWLLYVSHSLWLTCVLINRC